jgi:hypothetical protein
MEQFVHRKNTSPAANIQNDLVFEQVFIFDNGIFVCSSSGCVFLILVSGNQGGVGILAGRYVPTFPRGFLRHTVSKKQLRAEDCDVQRYIPWWL